MFKKMLSTIIAALVILSAFAVMPAMAAIDKVGTEYFRDDFENYVDGTEYGVSTTITDKSGVNKWSTRGSTGAEIVTVKGYDGEDTQAMKITLLDNSAGSSDDKRRFYSVTGDAVVPTTGIAVTEMSVFMPEETPFKRVQTSLVRFTYKGVTLYGDDNVIGTRIDDSEWHKIKVVSDLDNGTTITYFDDVMTTYHKFATGASPFFGGKAFNNLTIPDGAEFKDGKFYMFIDDVNMYSAPAATTAAATFPANGATGAALAEEPSVTFTHPLMNVVSNVSVGTDVVAPTTVVTPDNVKVEIIECADESKLGEVAVSEVALSNGNKTLTIKPEEDFPGASKIQVTVTGLKDDMDREIADVVYTFTTKEIPNLAGAPVFTKENLLFGAGSAITTLENGYIGCDYTLTNKSVTADINVLYFAVLKVDGVVESFQFMPATIAKNNGTATFKGGFTVKNAQKSVIEVYVWDNFKDMTSLVDAVVLDAE